MMISLMIVSRKRGCTPRHLRYDLQVKLWSQIIYDSHITVLLNLKQNAKFSDFQDENRLIFVVLRGRVQNLFWKKERYLLLVVTATITSNFYHYLIAQKDRTCICWARLGWLAVRSERLLKLRESCFIIMILSNGTLIITVTIKQNAINSATRILRTSISA